jgi:regulator of replication initiation timing
MARTATASAAHELQGIDRLEEKIVQLVTVIETLRADRARAMDEITRLQRDLEAARARLGEASTVNAEMMSLREERELIRTRVAQLIAQIDKLDL